jgi:phage tail sheath protein FI
MTYGRPGVYISETLLPAPLPQGPSANAAGAVVAPLPQGPETVTYITSWYQFTSIFGGYNAAYPATFAIATFFNNGGRELYVKRIMHSSAAAATVNIVSSGAETVATVTAKNRGAAGNNYFVKLSAGTVTGTYTLALYNTTSAGNVLLEQYQNIQFADTTQSDYAETVINNISSYITISATASGTPVLTAPYPLSEGADGSAVVSTDYTSYASTGISVWRQFDALNRALVTFTPNLFLTLGSGTTTVINDAIDWAEANDSFYVAETAANLTVDSAITFAQGLTASSNVAVYYPNIYISDPVGRSNSALRLVGPSAAVAGLYLATDASKGVFKAPAGLSASLAGVISVERSFSSTDLDNLNTGLPSTDMGSVAPVNPIRQVPGAGIVVMGARTLLQDGTSNRYVNMRRSLNYIEKRINAIAEGALFENNDDKLWTRLSGAIGTFLNEYRNQGGLAGATPGSSYYVLCDSTNNTSTSIQNGIVNIQVGVALEYPAEFVVININQMIAS